MKIKRVLLILATCVFLGGCGISYDNAITNDNKNCANGYFTRVSYWSDANGNYTIMYANDTKVKYLVFNGGYRYGITPLYNADGTLQIYEEDN
jgi:hypothetical protein